MHVPLSHIVGIFLRHCRLRQIGMTDMDIFDNEYGTTLHWVRQSVFCDISPEFEHVYRVHKVGHEPVFSRYPTVALTALVRALAPE